MCASGPKVPGQVTGTRLLVGGSRTFGRAAAPLVYGPRPDMGGRAWLAVEALRARGRRRDGESHSFTEESHGGTGPLAARDRRRACRRAGRGLQSKLLGVLLHARADRRAGLQTQL